MEGSFSLRGKVVIVTGASRGIGEAIARSAADHGAKVVLASRKIETLTDVANSIDAKAKERRAFAVAAHTGREDECKALVAAAVATFGQVDVLVNNAATNPHFGPMVEAPEGAWDKTFATNLKGYFWMAREVALHLRARKAPGSIVSITSVMGLEAAPLQGVYGMTKASIVSMTRTLAVELGPEGIRVNAIAPGFVKTRFSNAIVENEALSEHVIKKTALGRYATPEEIAGAAIYLASDASSFMTGHTMVVDGGFTIQ
ncbi:MAG: glucose 1-dehydrogenase [Polyangiaceae bacterium]